VARGGLSGREKAAILLITLGRDYSAELYKHMTEEEISQMTISISTTRRIAPELKEQIVDEFYEICLAQKFITEGGIDTIVGIVNSLDRGSERRLLEELELKDPEFTEEIRRHLFVFEDIAKLNNQAVQRILRDVDNNDLAIALKLATDDVSKIIFSNVSKRLADMIKDDMEVMGPVRVKDIEDAQQRIVAVIRKLDDDHEIIIARGEGDDMVV
jgi:flagellar motor switch protein FliG